MRVSVRVSVSGVWRVGVKSKCGEGGVPGLTRVFMIKGRNYPSFRKVPLREQLALSE